MEKSEFSFYVALKGVAVRIALIVVVAATVGVSGSSVLAQTDELVGNDIVVYGTDVSGEVKTRAGEEWFFSGCEADLVTVKMSSDEFDSFLELYGPTGRRPLIDDDDSGGDGNALIEAFELPESGVYTIVVAGSGRKDRGEYTLVVESDIDVDMDDSAALAYGESVVGVVSTARGEEWWFWGCADDLVSLTMESDELAGYLELYGPTGRRPLVEAASEAAEGDTAVVEISKFSLPESGLYTIVAAGQSRRDRGSYLLSLFTASDEEVDNEGSGDESDSAGSDDEDAIAAKNRRDDGPRSLSLPTSASDDTAEGTEVESTSVPTSVPEPEASPTSTAGVVILVPTLPPTSTPTPALVATATATATAERPSIPGLLTDFETWGVWRRGDEAWGTFTQSDLLAHGGQYAGKFDFDFPANEARNYLIYRQLLPISGEPVALTIWVYGDGSGNFLNAWVRDANDQSWQFTFGRINHSGWRQMRADLDLGLGWPNQAIGVPSTDDIVFPIQFEALVLDGADEDKAYKGSVLVDDLFSTMTSAPRPTPRTPEPRSTGQPVEEPSPDPRSTAEPVEEPSSPAVGAGTLPAPVAIGFHHPFFRWEWKWMAMMEDFDDWYFDVKIFENEFLEYPYDVKVAEVDSLVEESPNVWRFDNPTDFRCGSFWAVQVALRNLDGSYAGPLSPESNRLPSGQGCEEELP